MTFSERTRSALHGAVVLICAPLSLMKVLWTDNVCLVRRQELLMERLMSTVRLGWWSEYIYDKLKGENIAVNGGSGVMSALFGPRLMRLSVQKNESLELEVLTFFPLFSPRKNATSDSCTSVIPLITSHYYCQTCYHKLWWAITL